MSLLEVGLFCLVRTITMVPVLKKEVRAPFKFPMWSRVRHLASGSEGPGFESWLCQVEVESLGKALYMNFPHPTHV